VVRGGPGSLTRLAATPGALAGLTAALSCAVAGLLLSALVLRQVLCSLGSRVGMVAALRIFSAAQLGKYVPGPMWSAVTTAQTAKAYRVAPARMVSAYVLGSVVMLVTAVGVGLLAAPSIMGGRILWLLPLLLAGTLLIWRPALLVRLTDQAARLTHRPWLAQQVETRALRQAISLEFGSWLVSGLQLWLLVRILGVSEPRALPLCVGAFAIATTVGALALFTPDGLGVREVVLVGALATAMPLPRAAAAVLASRLCCTLVEIVGSGSVLLATARGLGTQRQRPEIPEIQEEVTGDGLEMPGVRPRNGVDAGTADDASTQQVGPG
jgi:glycosyltransferase 2 family protein